MTELWVKFAISNKWRDKMQTIELDEEFIDSLRELSKEDIVAGIVNNVMTGKCEYHGASDNWVLQDAINDALGDDFVSFNIKHAVINCNSVATMSAVQIVKIKARELLCKAVESFLNQHEVGVE